MSRLIFLSTLGAEFGPGQILRTTLRAEDRLWLLLSRMTAAGTETCIGRQVFAAAAALNENQLLMAAHGAELGG
jgi:hypothetical protein